MGKRSRGLVWLGAAVATAGVAFLALRRGDIPYDVLEERYAARTSRFLPLADGTIVHVRDDGDAAGPVLVLLHGYAASAVDWQPWIEELGTAYRIVTLDFPGHGLTATPARAEVTLDDLVDLVADVTARLGLKKIVLVGNSMGGQIAYRFALRWPRRLAGLVLINPLVSPPRPASAPSPIFRLLASGLGRALMRSIDLTPLVRRSLATAFHDASLVTPDLVRRYTDLARAPGHREILTTLQVSGAMTGSHDLPPLAMPTLLMVGEDDRLVPPADSRRLAQSIPGATIVAYPDVGHVPMQQIPERSAHDLDAWIREHVPPKRKARAAGQRRGARPMAAAVAASKR